MKKIFYIALCLFVIAMIVGCNQSKTDVTESTAEQPQNTTAEESQNTTIEAEQTQSELNGDETESNTLESQSEETTDTESESVQNDLNLDNDETGPFVFASQLYGDSYEDTNDIFEATLNTGGISEFKTVTYDDPRAEKSIKMTILETEYTLVYEYSIIYSESDIPAHVYLIEGTDSARVLFDTVNGEVIKYIGIPYAQKLVEEKDYIAFMKNFIPDTFNLQKFDYRCKTYYKSYSEGGASGEIADGFYVCSENEKLMDYTFYYTQSVGGVELPKFIRAHFYSGQFRIDINDIDYDASDIGVSGFKTQLDAHVEKYLHSITRDDRTLVSVTPRSSYIFVKNGQTYIATMSEIKFSTKKNPDTLFSSLVNTITSVTLKDSVQ